MIQRFEAYVAEGSVQIQLPDSQKAHSLMVKAEKRLRYVNERSLREEFAEFAFEDAYDVMREAATALMALKGFKPLSHEAVIAFLRDKEGLDNSDVVRFNGFRRLRNRSLYEAQEVSLIRAKESLQFAEDLFIKLRARLKA